MKAKEIPVICNHEEKIIKAFHDNNNVFYECAHINTQGFIIYQLLPSHFILLILMIGFF